MTQCPDRIDDIVPPGTTINPEDNSFANPALGARGAPALALTPQVPPLDTGTGGSPPGECCIARVAAEGVDSGRG